VSLTGRTTEFPLETLLRLLADTRKTGELVLRSGTAEGALGLADGRVVTAVCGDEAPIPALAAVLDMTDASFEFTPWDEAPPANLEGDLDTLRAKAAEHKQWYASIREVIPSDRSRFRLSERAADQGAVSFTSERWRVVLAVNGERDVQTLASHLSIERNDALNILASLVRDGVIEVVAEPPSPVAPPPAVEREPEAPCAAAPEPPAPAHNFRSTPGRGVDPVIDGVRYAVGGDRARYNERGQLVILGRESMCVNSGGEKIYVEEVERVVKSHPAVYDALVVGTPSGRWGQQVTAVVALRPGAASQSIDELRAHCAPHLADYKVPRALVTAAEIARSPSGKPDYAWAKTHALRGMEHRDA